jgi:hypothetical protein
MGLFDDLFHPSRPYKEAGKTLENYYNQGQGYIQPYNDRGNNIGNDLTNQYGKLTNPVDLQNEWAKNYTESPYAKQLQGEAQTAGNDAASSMGLGGSSAALGNIQQTSAGIVNADRQQYMNDLMQKYMTGIGLGQNMYGIGAGAAGQMGQNSMTQGQNQAGLKFGEKNAGPQMFGNVLGTIANMIGQYMGMPKTPST